MQNVSSVGIGSSSVASIQNSGTLTIMAKANAIAGDTAEAIVLNQGISQYVGADALSTATLNNSGSILIGATSSATSPLGSGFAVEEAFGDFQDVFSSGTTGVAYAGFVNGKSSTFQVTGLGVGSGSSEAYGIGYAEGVAQYVGGDASSAAYLSNSGSFIISALNTSSASNASADSYAEGVAQEVSQSSLGGGRSNIPE